ncbi:DUF2608 domain-containing protein [Marinicella sediminis]|uniref:DUF2608 domain-containing protein n=1 Tax=Marinicella sediminis TaxID=1792834 RepID=A0ABV7J9E6_9GAMM|nr:DUF2608 domain-containing protein [Marinicella sediminis]
MKKTLLPFSSLLLILVLTACSQPQKPTNTPVIHQNALSFVQVDEKVSELTSQYGAEQVLVILDIDNTLLTSHIDLGGDVWYQWQTEQLPIKPTADQKVKCLFQDAIGLLYELGPMDLTEHNVPALITQWQQQNSTVFALTSRSPDYRAATQRELTVHQIDFSGHDLTGPDGKTLVLDGSLGRPYSYIDGIMMTTGMNKGDMLQHMLGITGQDYSAVVFVDDSEKNIINMANAFPSSHLDMHLFHYTRIEHQRIASQGQVLTQAEADQMATQWLQINEVLNDIYPERKQRQATGCVAGD